MVMMISVIEHTTAPIQASAGLYGLDRTMALSQWQWGPRGALINTAPTWHRSSLRGRSVVEAPGGVSPAGALGKATPPPGPAAASTLPRRRGGTLRLIGTGSQRSDSAARTLLARGARCTTGILLVRAMSGLSLGRNAAGIKYHQIAISSRVNSSCYDRDLRTFKRCTFDSWSLAQTSAWL
jgi:hypothetical protein